MTVNVVVLAAGEGKRFKSALPKPLHQVAGRPLLWHVLAAAAPLGAARTVVGIGQGCDDGRAGVEDPSGYGRVLRDPDGAVSGIVEQRDATPEQAAITEMNVGVYVFGRSLLARLAELRPDNDQGEYYLTDLITLALQDGMVASCQ